MRYGRQLWTSFVAALVGLFLSITFALCVPGYRGAKQRAEQRACFATLKTLQGATEMYNLDFDTRVEAFDRTLLETLADQGYLQQVPEDPGQGAGSWQNYFLVPRATPQDQSQDGFETVCLHHGFIQPPAGTTLKDGGIRQLAAIGIEPGRRPQRYLPVSWLSYGDHQALRKILSGVLEAGVVLGTLASVLLLPIGLLRFLLYGVAEVAAYWMHGPAREASATLPLALAKVDLVHARCPVCADGFGEDTPQASLCPSCTTPHHEPCMRYIGHCAVFACSRTELTERRRQQALAEKQRTATG